MILFDNYHMVADANQFIVQRIENVEKLEFGTNKPTGEFKDKVMWEGYFATLESAIDASINECIRNKVMKEELKSLDDTVKEIKRLHDVVKKAVG